MDEQVQQKDMKKDQEDNVIWEGKPSLIRKIGSIDIVLVPLSVFVFMVMSVFEYNLIMLCINNNASPIVWFLLLPIIFLYFYSIYLLFGRFIYEHNLRKHTSYIITKDKIYIRRKNNIMEINPQKFKHIKVIKKQVNNGTITFSNKKYNFNHMFIGTGLDIFKIGGENRALKYIDDVDSVHQLIKNMI